MQWQASAARKWAPGTLPERLRALRVTPLLRSLLVASVASDTLPDKAELVVRLMLPELTQAAHAPTFLPWPASPAARRVADLAVRDHRNRLNLGELASRAATSVRTVTGL